MAKAKAKAAKAAKTAGNESLVVASKVKAYVKSKGLHSSSDMISALSDKVYCMLGCAMKKTEANRRSTVKPQDL